MDSHFLLGWLSISISVVFDKYAQFTLCPDFTRHPVDFASRVVSNKENATFAKTLASTSVGDTDVVREKLEDKALFVRDLPFPMQIMWRTAVHLVVANTV